LIALARREPVVPDEAAVYSNLGAALLGHALASAAGTDYPALLEERLFEPLGMDSASAPVTDADIPSGYATGFTSTGKETEPWADAGWAPAAGVYATLDDLVALCRAVIDGPLRDSAALEPVAPGPDGRGQLGYLWDIIDVDGRTLTGRDGLAGGFSSSLLIDRNAGQWVVVLVNEAPSVTRSDAIRLLEKLSASGLSDGDD
jgi:CubicO group peptidase (beta-lactamase class C family)